MKEYPYIQSQEKITNFICETCKVQKDSGFEVEWRVDIFQGNCEFEKICQDCLSKTMKRIKDDRKRRERIAEEQEARWIKRMQPKWDKLDQLLNENKIEVKKYENTGQWTFNNLIDWWTTTGTAIHRKTRQQYNFSVEKPEFIIKSIFKS